MRDLLTVKRKRNELKEELKRMATARENLYPIGTLYRNLDKEDKSIFSYLLGSIGRIKNQINVLEFVLNEDSEIDDATITNSFQDFTKEEVLRKAGVSTGCKCCKCKCERGEYIC